MSNNVLVFLESSTTGHLFIRAAQRLGFVPKLLSKNAGRYHNLSSENIDTITIDTGDIDAVIKACADLDSEYGLAGILSTSGAHAAFAATASQHFDLPGALPEAVKRCQNKFEQRKILASAGLATPSYFSATDTASAVEFASEVGLPVIVKPIVGSGSVGVRLCHELAEVSQQTAYLLDGKKLQNNPGALVEEFIVGPEFSIETFGEEVIGITAKHLGELPHFVEIGHDFPAQLSQQENEAIVDTVKRGLAALGLDWGPAHTEVRLSPKGPVIIEVNPRMGGDMIPELVRLAYDVDMVGQTIRLVTGGVPDLTKSRSHTASIRFLNPDRDGTLLWVDNGTGPHKSPEVTEIALYADSGTVIELHGDFKDRVGHVIATSSVREQTLAALERALAEVRFDIVNTLERTS